MPRPSPYTDTIVPDFTFTAMQAGLAASTYGCGTVGLNAGAVIGVVSTDYDDSPWPSEAHHGMAYHLWEQASGTTLRFDYFWSQRTASNELSPIEILTNAATFPARQWGTSTDPYPTSGDVSMGPTVGVANKLAEIWTPSGAAVIVMNEDTITNAAGLTVVNRALMIAGGVQYLGIVLETEYYRGTATQDPPFPDGWLPFDGSGGLRSLVGMDVTRIRLALEEFAAMARVPAAYPVGDPMVTR